MNEAPFKLLEPKVRTSNVVFASPHSGRDYPKSFLRQSRLDGLAIRSSEDAFVDLLFGDAPAFGAPLLVAVAPRAFIDFNRSADELDAALVTGVNESAGNTRVVSGLGVIPRVVTNGRAIYPGKITLREARRRLDGFWRPYHDRLEALLGDARERYGEAILIDCHSMPHAAIESVGRDGRPDPEIVLGDRFGAADGRDLVDRVEAAFSGAGLRVARNMPFAGAYTARHYGRPSMGQHVIQVEIDRALYMDERRIAPNGRFEAFRALMREVTREIAQVGRQEATPSAE